MIAVEGVTKMYGPVVAVEDLSFEVNSGEVVGFLGPNAAGKTTTMRMLVGTLQPDTGQVLLDGRSLSERLTEAKQRIGYMPESNALYTEMLVSEYLDFTADLKGLRGADRRSALADAVAETGIAEVFYRTVGELSKGYRQRVGLAATILHRPEVMILDEPTEGLDPNQRIEIRRLIRELGRDRTVLLSSHVLGEVEATCDRLLIINRGRLVAEGPVATLLEARNAGMRYTVEAEGDAVEEALAGMPGVTRQRTTEMDGRVRVELAVAGEEELRPSIYRLATERGWTLWELHRERGSLEHLFRQLTDQDDARLAGVGGENVAAEDDASAVRAVETGGTEPEFGSAGREVH